jgi:hypothetical protein
LVLRLLAGFGHSSLILFRLRVVGGRGCFGSCLRCVVVWVLAVGRIWVTPST